jgi:hypothetical protein
MEKAKDSLETLERQLIEQLDSCSDHMTNVKEFKAVCQQRKGSLEHNFCCCRASGLAMLDPPRTVEQCTLPNHLLQRTIFNVSDSTQKEPLGVILGGAFGGCAGALCICSGILGLWRWRRRKQPNDPEAATGAPTPPMAAATAQVAYLAHVHQQPHLAAANQHQRSLAQEIRQVVAQESLQVVLSLNRVFLCILSCVMFSHTLVLRHAQPCIYCDNL